MATAYLEQEGKLEYKYWEITLNEENSDVTVSYGASGYDGRVTVKKYESAEEAQKYYDKSLKGKIKSGYVHSTRDFPLEFREAMDAINKGESTTFKKTIEHEKVLQGLWSLTNLKELTLELSWDLRRTYIIPRELGNLINLEKLTINQLESPLPAELGKLTQLKQLRLYGGTLKSIPEEIGNLTHLEKLDLSCNHLTQLPSSLAQLTELKELKLRSNELSGLPDSYKALQKLEFIDLEKNELTQIPPFIFELGEIKKIILEDNAITSLPGEIGNLKKLEELNLEAPYSSRGKQLIEILPLELFTLVNLKELNISDHNIKNVPREIVNLTAIEEVDLTGNPIENIPEDVLSSADWDGIGPIISYFERLDQKGGKEAVNLQDKPLTLSPEDKKEILERRDRKLKDFKDETSYSDKNLQKEILDYLTGEVDQIPLVTGKHVRRFDEIINILSPIDEWTFIDERVFKIITQEDTWFWQQKKDNDKTYDRGLHNEFFDWVEHEIKGGRDSELMQKLLPRFEDNHISEDLIIRHCLTEIHDQLLREDGSPTSAGQFLLERVKEKMDLMLEISQGYIYRYDLVELLARHSMPLLEPHIESILKKEMSTDGTVHVAHKELESIVKTDPVKFEAYFYKAVEQTNCGSCQANLARMMTDYYGEKYRSSALQMAQGVLTWLSIRKNGESRFSLNYSTAGRWEDGTPLFVEWLLMNFGNSATEMLFNYVSYTKRLDLEVVELASQYLGQESVPIIGEALNMGLDNDRNAHYRKVFKMLDGLDYSAFHERVWELVSCDADKLRDLAARALAKLGEGVFIKAQELLTSKKKDERDGGIRILCYLDTPQSREILQTVSKEEKSDDLRDFIVASLLKGDDPISLSEARERIVQAHERKKLSKQVKAWLDESALPKMKWAETGEELTLNEVRYLVYRQNREKFVKPDVELKVIYPLIDRESSGEFALKLFKLVKKNGGICAKNRFALTLVGKFGDDRLIDELEEITIKNKNETTPTVLGLIGSDGALRSLSRIMRHFKTKYPNVKGAASEAFEKVAQQSGMTYFELADSIIPTFGFDGLSLPLEIEGGQFKAMIGPGLKLVYFDVEKGKTLKSLPKGASKELKKEMKSLSKDIREVGKEVLQGLEQSLVIQRKWATDEWKSFFTEHPILFSFAPSLIWGVYKDKQLTTTFRTSEEGEFLSAENDEIELPLGEIGLAHPIELGANLLKWKEHLVDYEISQPFPQLERMIFSVEEEKKNDTFYYHFKGSEVPCGTFKSRATKQGWQRGSVVDAGEVSDYLKTFSNGGVQVFLNLENLNVVTYDYDEKALLKECYFVPYESIKLGSYIYDEPRSDSDERLIKLKDVPPIVFSEAIWDLTKISKLG